MKKIALLFLLGLLALLAFTDDPPIIEPWQKRPEQYVKHADVYHAFEVMVFDSFLIHGITGDTIPIKELVLTRHKDSIYLSPDSIHALIQDAGINTDGWDKDVSDDLELGITSTTAHRGDRGNYAYNHALSDGDKSSTNELQDLQVSNNILIITGISSPTEVNLSAYAGDNTDEQQLTKSGNFLSLSSTTGSPSQVDLSEYETPALATVATTGSYNDLFNKPVIPSNLFDLTSISNTGWAEGLTLKFDINGNLSPAVDNVGTGGGITLESLSASLPLSYNPTTGTFSVNPSYQIPTTAQFANHETAYSWGNHAGLYKSISYVPSWTEILDKPSFITSLWGFPEISNTGWAEGLTVKFDINGNLIPAVDNVGTGGGITLESLSASLPLSYNPTTGTFSVNPSYQIPTTTQFANHEMAYNWGDHKNEGYLKNNDPINISGNMTGSGSTAINLTAHHSLISDRLMITGLKSTDEFLINFSSGDLYKSNVGYLKDFMQSNLTFTTDTDTDVLVGLEGGTVGYKMSGLFFNIVSNTIQPKIDAEPTIANYLPVTSDGVAQALNQKANVNGDVTKDFSGKTFNLPNGVSFTVTGTTVTFTGVTEVVVPGQVTANEVVVQ